LILVSDLHLADSRDRSSFDDVTFLRGVHACVKACPDGEKPTLVLLGDIFELLKSTRWLLGNIRPWHPPTPKLAEVAVLILDEIARLYPAFFDGLRELHDTGQIELVYVPGNHDALLADEGGGPTRAKLRALLPVQGSGEEPWRATYPDAAHGVYAEH